MLAQIFRDARKSLAHLCVGVAALCAWPARPAEFVGAYRPAETRPAPDARAVDAALERAALAALAGRDGAVVVLDARTGRVRAAANPRLAATAFPPGSAVKPFTLLASLRSGLLRPDSRLLCRKHFRRADADYTCAHPVFKPPFDAAQALAHSCNFFFARLGERLDAKTFRRTLDAHGLPTRPNVPPDDSQATPAPRAAWDTNAALGEGGALVVTPLRLVAAYAALLNGGRLYEARQAAPENFSARELSRVTLSEGERALLVAGMRGAVRFGTAESSELDELPLAVFGKTGTATEVGGFRTHGWFVGFASDAAAREHDGVAPERVKLGVLVFLARGQGKQAAAAARGVFAEYARLVADGADADGQASGGTPRPSSASPQPRAATSQSTFENRRHDGRELATVRVRPGRDAAAAELPLEEYLFGVLAAEASTEDEFAALKAQAVVSRTYALRHAARHAREGFDFCATTHCQRYLRVTRAEARPDFHAMLREAIAATAGERLQDSRGAAAAAYFSASCGGMTADVSTLWGDEAREPFERGVRDEACSGMAHSRWTDAVPARQLLAALREDPRSDVGSRLAGVRVVRRDRTGRAELVEVSGDRRRTLRGWDFKIIVGRTLGWSVLKSSRFTVERAGDRFVFRGSGFGHGLGLCQQGAHVLARRGADYRQILAHYFPGARLARHDDAARRAGDAPRNNYDPSRNGDYSSRGGVSHRGDDDARAVPAAGWMADAASPLHLDATPSPFLDAMLPSFLDAALPPFADAASPIFLNSGASAAAAPFAAAPRAPAPARLTLSSENFRATYEARSAVNTRREVEAALATLEAARRDLLGRLAAASLAAPALPRAEINFNETTADFVAATGQPAWAAAATRGRRVELQPLALLRRRGVVAETLRHELAHLFVAALSRGRAPRWLTEGLAAHFAGEGALLSPHAPRQPIPVAELERRLAAPAAAAEMRALYAAAHRQVAALVRAEGEPAVWRRASRP